MYGWTTSAMGRRNQVWRRPSTILSGRIPYETPTSVSPCSKRHDESPVGRPAAYQPGASGTIAVAGGGGAHTFHGEPPAADTPPPAAARTSPRASRDKAATPGSSTRHPLQH